MQSTDDTRDIRLVLERTADLSVAEVVDLLLTDQVRRWRQGERIPAEAYLQLHPALSGSTVDAVDLVYGEYVLREELGETPSLEEYRWRFPRFAADLQRQIGLHRALQLENEAATEEGCPITLRQGRPGGTAPTLGPVVDGYEVLEQLGRGGMGVVYRAWHLRLNRPVALKLILGGALADADRRERFSREAEAVAQLRHPHIVQVYEIGEQEGQLFLALEYVEGGSLAQRLHGTPQQPGEAAQLLETLARAMHYAHEQGIVHRDLKPANLLIADCGLRIADSQTAAGPASPERNALQSAIRNLQSAIKITDFGLAKRLDGTGPGSPTQTGDILGTPEYMAPEQALGQVKAIGPRVDVYALGAILYELLTGRPPFRGATGLDTLQQVVRDEPLPPRRLQPKVPRDLETICLNCLRKEPAHRYASAEALADDLRRFLAGEPIQARPSGAVERAVKWARRRPAGAALLLVSAVACVALGAGGVWHTVRLQEEVRRVEREQQRALASMSHANAVAAELLMLRHREGPSSDTEARLYLRSYLHNVIEQGKELIADTQPTTPAVQREVGRAYHVLGMCHSLREEVTAAHAYFGQAQEMQTRLVEAEPENLDYRIDLAMTWYSLSELETRRGRGTEAEAAVQKAMALIESVPVEDLRVERLVLRMAHELFHRGKLAEAMPWLDRLVVQVEGWHQEEKQPRRQQAVRGLLKMTCVLRALSCMKLARFPQALRDWDRVCELESASPPVYWQCMRALSLAQSGDHEQAAAELNHLAGRGQLEGDRLKQAGLIWPLGHVAVLVYAGCRKAALQDMNRTSAERDRLGDDYGTRCVAILEKARAAGVFETAAHRDNLLQDEALEPLRARDDFQQFLRKLSSSK